MIFFAVRFIGSKSASFLLFRHWLICPDSLSQLIRRYRVDLVRVVLIPKDFGEERERERLCRRIESSPHLVQRRVRSNRTSSHVLLSFLPYLPFNRWTIVNRVLTDRPQLPPMFTVPEPFALSPLPIITHVSSVCSLQKRRAAL
jgi:hypothetical protein